MYRVNVAIEELSKKIEKYKQNKIKDKNNESLIDLLKSIDNVECIFHNYIYDLLREFPEVLHRYVR